LRRSAVLSVTLLHQFTRRSCSRSARHSDARIDHIT
jgi:hypothetical protein